MAVQALVAWILYGRNFRLIPWKKGRHSLNFEPCAASVVALFLDLRLSNAVMEACHVPFDPSAHDWIGFSLQPFSCLIPQPSIVGAFRSAVATMSKPSHQHPCHVLVLAVASQEISGQ